MQVDIDSVGDEGQVHKVVRDFELGAASVGNDISLNEVTVYDEGGARTIRKETDDASLH